MDDVKIATFKTLVGNYFNQKKIAVLSKWSFVNRRITVKRWFTSVNQQITVKWWFTSVKWQFTSVNQGFTLLKYLILGLQLFFS